MSLDERNNSDLFMEDDNCSLEDEGRSIAQYSRLENKERKSLDIGLRNDTV